MMRFDRTWFPRQPEAELVLLLGRPVADQEVVSQARRLADQAAWDRFLALVFAHQIYPIVERNLALMGDSVPRSVRLELLAARQLNDLRAARLEAAQARLLNALRHHGIAAAAWKGPALAKRLFGDPANRHSEDLDILVLRERWEEARDVLRSLGYRPVESVGPNERRYAISFIGTDPGGHGKEVHVELHYDADLPYLGYRLGGVLNEVLHYGGERTAPEAELILLAVHAVRHRDLALKWLVDIDTFVRRIPLDWDRLVSLAEESRTSKAVLAVLSASRTFYGTPFPSPGPSGTVPLAGFGALHTEPARADRIPDLWFIPGIANPPLWRIWLAKASLVEGGWPLRLALLWRRLANPPAEGDEDSPRLPPSLAWLYPVVRIGRERNRRAAYRAAVETPIRTVGGRGR